MNAVRPQTQVKNPDKGFWVRSSLQICPVRQMFAEGVDKWIDIASCEGLKVSMEAKLALLKMRNIQAVNCDEVYMVPADMFPTVTTLTYVRTVCYESHCPGSRKILVDFTPAAVPNVALAMVLSGIITPDTRLCFMTDLLGHPGQTFLFGLSNNMLTVIKTGPEEYLMPGTSFVLSSEEY